jgi:hypothetical protein
MSAPRIAATAAAALLSSVVGPPIVLNNVSTGTAFDSPYLALPTIGITANAETVVFARGASVFDVLAEPLQTGLGPDSSNVSYSHCGKWLNAAIVDAMNTSIVHGFFHQEWSCDYAHNLYTNKSIAYARSEDGGLHFAPWSPSGAVGPAADQIIAGSNFSTSHQCGEGDHGVVRVGEYLYMLFREWDAPNGLSTGLARAPVSSGGAPGSWVKFYNGSFDGLEPGVGGQCDAIEGAAGTAMVRMLRAAGGGVDALASIGLAYAGGLTMAWASAAAPPAVWSAALAGPLFPTGASDWNRNVNSSELFAYPSLVSDAGSPDASMDPSENASVVFTYLAPRATFASRWLVRRPVAFFERAAGGGASLAPPPALVALSLWAARGGGGGGGGGGSGAWWWATSGPVTDDTPGGFSLARAQIALVFTSPAGVAGSVEVVECADQQGGGGGGAPRGGRVALAARADCGAAGGALASGVVLRTAGWLAPSARAADAVGWSSVARAGGDGAPAARARAGALWRCKGQGAFNFSAAFGDASCEDAGAGFAQDLLLGFALGALETLPQV